jgi:spore maturation protein CgeB
MLISSRSLATHHGPTQARADVSRRPKKLPYRHQAHLSPTINEPHAEQMRIDLDESVFKVLGSDGMTITDVTPAYREWFTPNELLVPSSLAEYHDLVRQALEDDDFNQRYRQTGYEAVKAQHTYAHRARTLLEHVGIDPNR